MRMRRWIVLLPLAAGLALAACVVNPVSGKRELMLISQSQEIQLGEESDKEVRKEYAIYTEKPDLTAYVQAVGQKLASHSDRSDIAYHFTIVDAPEINAFALPGGYVYITRGIMVQMNSEDEMAAVLGHEIGHVCARHSASQISKAQIGQLGLAGVAIFTDPQYAAQLEQVAGLAFNIAMSGYSRDDERQADDLGTKYAKRAGYNPEGAVSLMKMLARTEKSQPSEVERWFMSHPDTSERIANLSKEVQGMEKTAKKALDRPILRDPYLSQINGIIVGDSGQEGVFSGGRFYSRTKDYSLLVPKGWDASLKGSDLYMVQSSGGGQALMQVQTLARAGVSGEVARDYVRTGAAEDGLEPQGAIVKATLPAGEAAIVKLMGRDKQGRPYIIKKAFLVRFDRAYVLTFVTPEEKADDMNRTFMELTGSIKYLGPDDLNGIKEPRLKLYTVKAGDTWTTIATGQIPGGKLSAGDLAGFNGMDTRESPSSGLLVKIPPAGVLE